MRKFGGVFILLALLTSGAALAQISVESVPPARVVCSGNGLADTDLDRNGQLDGPDRDNPTDPITDRDIVILTNRAGRETRLGLREDLIAVCASEIQLTSDSTQAATVTVFLVDARGNILPEETVRIEIEAGIATLDNTPLGENVLEQLAPGLEEVTLGTESDSAVTSTILSQVFSQNQAVDAIPLGDGRYVARFFAGNTAGQVQIKATWTSSNDLRPDGRLPFESLTFNLVEVADLDKLVDGTQPAGPTNPTNVQNLLATSANGLPSITSLVALLDPPDPGTLALAPLPPGVPPLPGSEGEVYLESFNQLDTPSEPIPGIGGANVNPQEVREIFILADNQTLNANQEDQATVMAYLVDGRGRPVNNKTVTFNVVRGTGTISGVDGGAIIADNGRYAAVYTAGNTPSRRIVDAAGNASFVDDVVRVTIADGTQFLSDEVPIRLFETSVLSAFAFPEEITRLPASGVEPLQENISTISVTVRDGRGVLVPGLTADLLNAEVIAGPGAITEVAEIPLESGFGSGVYQATYVSDTAVGLARIRFTDLSSVQRPQVDVEINVVQVAGDPNGIAVDFFPSKEVFGSNASLFERICEGGFDPLGRRFFRFIGDTGAAPDPRNLDPRSECFVEGAAPAAVQAARNRATGVTTIGKLPLNADGLSEALLVALATNQNELAVTDQFVEFRVTRNTGLVTGATAELVAGVGGLGTGVYVNTYQAGAVAGAANRQGDVNPITRATLINDSGETIIGNVQVALEPNQGPRLFVFPPRLPADQLSLATIDIIDFDANTDRLEEFVSDRYDIDIVQGGGRIIDDPINDGTGSDLVANDHIQTAVYQAGAAFQPVQFLVTDRVTSGLPSSRAFLNLGSPTILTAIAFPNVLDPRETAAIMVFATDEFGNPVPDHNIIFTIEVGNGSAVSGGLLLDDGGQGDVFADAYLNDGIYLGEFVASATASTVSGEVRLRINDLTDPTQPTVRLNLLVLSDIR
ncbi:MAG: hypothetical protein HY335_07295 [Deinococcus sp.]|nr:hypothetical protein [Deinococcus sp.]